MAQNKLSALICKLLFHSIARSRSIFPDRSSAFEGRFTDTLESQLNFSNKFLRLSNRGRHCDRRKPAKPKGKRLKRENLDHSKFFDICRPAFLSMTYFFEAQNGQTSALAVRLKPAASAIGCKFLAVIKKITNGWVKR